jgi:uncharacterized delta-60 repeat protein
MSRPSPFVFARVPFLAVLALSLSLWVPKAAAQLAGSLDNGFTLYKTAGDRVISVSPQPDGKIVFGGTFSQIDGAPRSTLARVNADGSLDTAFVPPIIESYNTRTDATITQLNPFYVPAVFTTVVQNDGKILVGGSFYFVNGVAGYGGLVRLNADGSLDTAFQAPRFSGNVFAIVPLANGEYLVGGDFSYVGSDQRNCLVLLKASGKVDLAFNAGVFAGTLSSNDAVSTFPTVASLAVQSDGKIIAGGIFTTVNGTSRRGLARFRANGKLDKQFVADANFNPPSASGPATTSVDQVLSVALQSDGKILVGGTFSDPKSGDPINSLVRLNTDGTFDTAFNPGGAGTEGLDDFGAPLDPTVKSIILESDGKILIAGSFHKYNDVNSIAIARLNVDGTLDPTFSVGNGSPGSGPGDDVLKLAIEPDGKLLAGGIFESVDGVARPLVARFNLVADAPPGVVVSIVASSPNATRAGVKGVDVVTRAGGNLSAPLTVKYFTSGTAQPGIDYRKLTGAVTIPGGSSSATIKVKPLADSPATGKVSVVVHLSDSAAYGVGSPGLARVRINEGQ